DVSIVRPHDMKHGQVRRTCIEHPLPALKQERWRSGYVDVVSEEWHRSLLKHWQIRSIYLQLLGLICIVKRIDPEEIARNPEGRETRHSSRAGGERGNLRALDV